MRLNVKPILNTPGKHLDFSLQMDLSDLEFAGRRFALQPIFVEGTVRNSADVLELRLTAHTVLDCICDRCAKAFAKEKEVSYTCLLAEELQDEQSDEIVLLENGEVDVEELARTAFILEMDTRILCSEDCKGLCPRCGADLNLGACTCQREVDPRMAVLAKLLKNNQQGE